MQVGRRNFLVGGAMLAASGVVKSVAGAESKGATVSVVLSDKAKKLIATPPVLENAAETSMGVAFAVNDLANGFVEYSQSPELTDPIKVKCGGYRVTALNEKVILVRLRDLKPNTKYYYRIGADRIHYGGGYDMKILGTEVDTRIYSFTTAGKDASSHFCVINDTHEQSRPMNLALDKIDELNPPLVVWNGDASNTSETIDRVIKTFLDPPVTRKDYASFRPYLFTNGNHDLRGRANRENEKVMMFRDPAERDAKYWDLGRNYAFRQGDIAMIGLDTGEDKPDTIGLFAGLFKCDSYRDFQAEWLADQFKRPEIAEAPYVVAFCHIPIWDSEQKSNPGGLQTGFAHWYKQCFEKWGPILTANKVQLVVTAHQHCYRHDACPPGHTWEQIVGGGPECGERIISWKPLKKKSAPQHFPTVIEGKVEDGKLVVRVHDVLNKRIAGQFAYEPRKTSGLFGIFNTVTVGRF